MESTTIKFVEEKYATIKTELWKFAVLQEETVSELRARAKGQPFARMTKNPLVLKLLCPSEELIDEIQQGYGELKLALKLAGKTARQTAPLSVLVHTQLSFVDF